MVVSSLLNETLKGEKTISFTDLNYHETSKSAASDSHQQ